MKKLLLFILSAILLCGLLFSTVGCLDSETPEETTAALDGETSVGDESATGDGEESTTGGNGETATGGSEETTTGDNGETATGGEEATTDGEEESTTGGNDTEPHVHAFGEWVTVTAATCTAEGQKERVCACGEKETEKISASGHTEAVIPAKVATCTAAGLTEGKKCSVCGEILVAQNEIKATGHTYTETVTAPTCTEQGYTTNTCACGYSYKDNYVTATGHTYTETVTAPTCTEQGYTAHTCACGDSYKDTYVTATGHNMGEWVQIKAPTCTAKGEEKRACKNCDRYETREVAAKGHSYTETVTAPTCTEQGYTIYTCACGDSYKDNYVDAKGHNMGGWTETKTPTCTAKGEEKRTCKNCDHYETKAIEAKGHDYSNGVGCSLCGLKINVAAYAGDYGYNALKKQTNGTAKCKFYDQMDKVAIAFHTDFSNATDNIVSKINYAEFGLTQDEAFSVWVVYKNDHPLYYWMSASASVIGTTFILQTEPEYANGEDRIECNNLVYTTIEEWVAEIDTDSAYEIALAAHDKIIYAIDYAYEDDGTPQSAIWAHNILGVFEKGSGVCESYARTFQIILNYCGVENIFVVGESSNENHAWNLAKMDDGNWYWFDLTWDDAPSRAWGVRYNFFCVNDTQNVNWSDFGWVYAEETFLQTHSTNNSTDNLTLFDLPARSAQTYSADFLLRDQFTVNGLTYAWIGHNAAMLVSVNVKGAVVIPENVTYNGTTYEVIAIGHVSDKGLIDELMIWSDSTSLNGNGVTSITIPKTVRFIGQNALRSVTLEEIIVDKDNPYFTSLDGVLFTKHLYTLIQYPGGNSRTEYTIPDQTVDIAYWAFVGQTNISILYIGKNLEGLGIVNWGAGYCDAPSVGGVVNIIAGGWDRIVDSMVGNKRIIISSDNPNYSADEIGVYSDHTMICIFDLSATSLHISKDIWAFSYNNAIADMKNLETITVDKDNEVLFVHDGILYSRANGKIEVILVPRTVTKVTFYDGLTSIGEGAFKYCTVLTEITIPDGVTSIGDEAFWGCYRLTSITIPSSVKSIGEHALCNCARLTSIYFNGTRRQWKAISKGNGWNSSTGSYTLYRTDDDDNAWIDIDDLAGFIEASFDDFTAGNVHFSNTTMTGNCFKQLDAINGIVSAEIGKISSVDFRGWAWFDQKVLAFGYSVNGADPVWNNSFIQDRPDLAAANKGENAVGFNVSVPVSGLEIGTHKVACLVKLEDGTIVCFYEIILAIKAQGEAETPVIVPGEPYQAPLNGSGSKTDAYMGSWSAAGYDIPVAVLGYDNWICLGKLDLSQFTKVTIMYGSDGGDGTKANYEAASSLAIGLKSTASSYGQETTDDFDGDIAHTEMVFVGAGWAIGQRAAVIDLTNVDYNGVVYVTVHNPAGTQIAITSILFE